MITRAMESRLSFWLMRLAASRPGFMCWVGPEPGDEYCCGIVWHQVDGRSMQAIEVFIGDDLEARCLRHPIEPLRPVGSLLQ